MRLNTKLTSFPRWKIRKRNLNNYTNGKSGLNPKII